MKEILPVDMVVFPIIYTFLDIPSGFLAGFLPSTLSSYLAFVSPFCWANPDISLRPLGRLPNPRGSTQQAHKSVGLFLVPKCLKMFRFSRMATWESVFFWEKKKHSETNKGSLKKTWPTRIFGNGSVDSVLRLVDTLEKIRLCDESF